MANHSQMHADQLLTSKQVAALIGLKNEKTLAVWRSTKRYPLPYVKFGRSVRYRAADVQKFLELKTIPATGFLSNASLMQDR
jgi:predicted DNA-binding transcriptional regulator AlpA